jgi:hypothetical protein
METHQPTMRLRLVAFSCQHVLQQLWEPVYEGYQPEWRDVPLVHPAAATAPQSPPPQPDTQEPSR